ncbi:MAG: sigma-70 family RNA polymerase sigma factor, partial [Candidatus Caenarcaniphilales bacterium]|nr:sigma-70 family RNA polymerase sigma factor [Candidatus Caenarcaniphilales bacterium]
RSRDFLSRTGRTRVKRFQEAVSTLERTLGRSPSDEEVQQALNIDNLDLRGIQREASAIVFSLDSTEMTKPFEESRTALVDNLASDSQSQEDYTEKGILREKLAKAIDALNPRERLIVALYHYQKLTFKEIGEVLNVSESRTSQLHMKILQKLRTLLKDFEI